MHQKDTENDIANRSVDRHAIDCLSANHLISPKAREHALDLLYGDHHWGLWAYRTLLAIGISLILSGVVCFFAFNWSEINSTLKFAIIEFSILVGLIGTQFFQLNKLSGKISLLASSVLVGVFLAVFGQIYQTSTDASLFFILWTLLILPWVIISKFLASWALWIVVANLSCIFYWLQFEKSDVMLLCLILLNSTFLAFREYGIIQKVNWLKGQWFRLMLLAILLVVTQLPIYQFIFNPAFSDLSDFNAILAVVAHIGFYATYRFKLCDIWSLSAILSSVCLIATTCIGRLLYLSFNEYSPLFFFITGVSSLAVFSTALLHLQFIIQQKDHRE